MIILDGVLEDGVEDSLQPILVVDGLNDLEKHVAFLSECYSHHSESIYGFEELLFQTDFPQ